MRAIRARSGRARHPCDRRAARLERLTEFFQNEVATGKLAGVIVLIQQHGRPVYLKCFGVRDVATKQPMTPDTIFALHSMTKPITSLAAMMLIDEGKLALADPVSKYIPSFAKVQVGVDTKTESGTEILKLEPPHRPVNIEDLLRHTSGITYDYIGGDLIKKAYMDADIFEGHFDNKEFAERIARLPLSRQPGTLWRYGHSTDVLGRIIEIVSGKSLYQFLRQRILSPLGMTSTKFVLHGKAEWARMAEPLPTTAFCVSRRASGAPHPEWESGGGGLVSTITDYARFAQMLLNGGKLDGKQYLGPTAFKQMTIRPYRPGLRRRAGLLLLSRRWLWLWLWSGGPHRSGQCETAAGRLDRRTEMGQRQRHLFRRRSEARHVLHPDGADADRARPHPADLQETGLRRLRKMTRAGMPMRPRSGAGPLEPGSSGAASPDMPHADGLVPWTRCIADARTQNCENNPMQSRNGASHHPKTQDLASTGCILDRREKRPSARGHQPCLTPLQFFQKENPRQFPAGGLLDQVSDLRSCAERGAAR